jgi:hypothetical protein
MVGCEKTGLWKKALRVFRIHTYFRNYPANPYGTETCRHRIIWQGNIKIDHKEVGWLSETFRNKLVFLRRGVLYIPPPLNPQDGGSPPVGCPRLLVQYISSYPPYLEAVSIRNLRTRLAMVTKTHLAWERSRV